MFVLFLIHGVCSVALESVLGKNGESVTLHTGEMKQQNDMILWYFNDIRIAMIDRDPSKSCLYEDEGGRFRDRLEVNYETGSLSIKNFTAELAGQYEAEIIRRASSGTTQNMNQKPKCDSTKVIRKTNNMGDTIITLNVSVSGPDESTKEEPRDSDSGLSAGAIAGICAAAAVLLLVAVGFVIYFKHKRGNAECENGVV